MSNHITNLLGINQLTVAQQQFASANVVWYHLNTTALPTEKGEYAGSFSHLIFKSEQGPISNLFDAAFNILCVALDQEKKILKELYRIRLGLITRTPYLVTHDAHIDDGRPHNTGLFYVIESDGDTLIYNEKKESKNYTVQESVKPVCNTWHSFDGAQFHSSQTPVANERRIVLTFNYTTV